MSVGNLQFEPVLTRAALALKKKNKPTEFQATVFEEPKRLIRQSNEFGTTDDIEEDESRTSKNNTNKKSTTSDKDELEFDIKKARHEVLRFAMNNQRIVKNKKKMEIFQAVKLGAKPPKKPYKNYKDLLDERKRLKTIREERRKFHQLGKNQAGAASVKCRSKTKLEKQKKKRAPVASIAQHYGVANPKFKKNK